ncbi:MAG: prephenate dehydrogenase/arogenate dehydrogenase family protein [Gemmatimonadota bacterium]|nr:MAG: prephenate dehydrogenase/arogenate dehydrogenase family protein [Gemmatimonadota bacterium]
MKPDCLGVIGLSELGGSVAWQAARAGVERIIGFSRVRKDGVAAVRARAVTEMATSVKRVAEVADLLVLATPVSETVHTLRSLAATIATRSVYCTDLSGVKGPVVKAAVDLGLGERFAGSNVLVARGDGGFSAARPDRFTGQIVYVSPAASDGHAALEVADFWQRVLGLQPVTIDAERHDRILGWTSHFPQAVAAALAKTLASRGPKGITYGPTALAILDSVVSDTEAWADALLHNRQQLTEALEGFGLELRSLESALRRGDRQAVRSWLEAGSNWRKRAVE